MPVRAYTRWILKWRWPVLLLSLLGFGALASGMPRITFAGDYRIFFNEDNPLRSAFEDFQNTYAKNEGLLIVLAPADGDVFTSENLSVIEGATTQAWQIPFSTRVDSLTNFQRTTAEDDDLLVADLVVDAATAPADELRALRDFALAEPRLVQRLVSKTGHVAAIYVSVEFEGDNPEKLAAAVTAARQLARDVESEHPGMQVYLSGAIMLHNAFMEATQQDLETLVPAMYGVIFVLMMAFLRSLAGTLVTVVVVVLAAGAGMGAAGWMGVALTPVSAVAPTLIMTLAVADSLHILMSLRDAVGKGLGRTDAIVETMVLNFKPVLVTSVTTALGFLSMNSSDAPPLHDLGNVTAIGVLAAFVASVVVLPILMSFLPLGGRGFRSPAPWPILDRLSDIVIHRRRAVLWGTSLVILVLAALVPTNAFDDSYIRYFDERVEFRQHTEFVLEHLTGLYQLEYSLDSGAAGGIGEPEYLRAVDRFAEWWRQQPEVRHVESFADTMKELNRTLHGDDGSWYRIPETREMAAQYLLLYELSLPFGLDLNHQIDIDKAATRFSVTLDELTSNQMIELSERGNRWLVDNAPGMASDAVGPSVMFAHIAIQNIYSMMWGTLLAILLISLTLVFALRSAKLGALSLIPNLAPAVMGFGLWGLLVGQIGFLLSVVLAMTLGIVVDDTVHIMSKYQRARDVEGKSPEEAVRQTLGTVGKALVATTSVLSAGFAILALSTFAQNAEMGRLTVMIIVLALVADFLLLPALFLWIDGPRFRPADGPQHEDLRP